MGYCICLIPAHPLALLVGFPSLLYMATSTMDACPLSVPQWLLVCLFPMPGTIKLRTRARVQAADFEGPRVQAAPLEDLQAACMSAEPARARG
jgi:hypothetical protein